MQYLIINKTMSLDEFVNECNSKASFFEDMINSDAGYRRGGLVIQDPKVKAIIKGAVNRWIKI